MKFVNRAGWSIVSVGLLMLASCSSTRVSLSDSAGGPDSGGADRPYVLVLGTAQDGGYPQAGCKRECCAAAWRDASKRRGVACIAVIDPASEQRWMFDATPNFPDQLRLLDEIAPPASGLGLSGVLLTHAHIGHYTGLMYLGREALGARDVPVYAMPRMRTFLETNGPWDQLVRLRNIELRPMEAGRQVALNDRVRVTPLLVPHRHEYSETVGFRIDGPHRSVLYIPDIDKWDRWDRSIEDLITDVDAAYLDGTFFADGEVSRPMAEIPHPFITESMRRFEPLAPEDRAKVHFIHLNHTNPALRPDSDARRRIDHAGFRLAEVGERIAL